MFEDGSGRGEPAATLDADGFDTVVAELFGATPSPESLVTLLSVHARRESLNEVDRMTLAGIFDRHLSYLTAMNLQAIAAAVGPEPTRESADPLDDFAREELAFTLGVGPGTAHDRMMLARALTARFPAHPRRVGGRHDQPGARPDPGAADPPALRRARDRGGGPHRRPETGDAAR